nr:putative diphthine methyl ester synthase [Tanacetum cinerariifolium]
GRRTSDDRTYNLPTTSEIAVLIVGDIEQALDEIDIVVESRNDAMTLCKWFGHPDFFITFTCNPKWPDISRFVRKRGLKPEDRPEVLCRMFKFKLDHLIKNLKDNQIFGRVQAVVYTIEFQKCGLPHSHICLFLHKDDKLLNPERINDFISTEILDKDLDLDLYTLVTEHMMHAGYPVYRHREDGKFVEKNRVRLDNGFVVPYNSYLLKKYQAYINVEWCNQAGSIKYLFKYINKGPDRVTAKIQVRDRDNEAPSNIEVVDKIKDYYDCRYLSACESSWHILKYEVFYRTPAVERLLFHLPSQQQVVYDDIDDVLNKPLFVWIAQKRIWQERKRGYAVGRIHYVPRSVGDAYYLRVLLNKVKEPISWDKLYEYDDIIHPSFRDACFACGLLDDDEREYILGLEEIHGWELGNKVRFSFVHLLMSNSMSRPDHVWNETWKFMKDDIEHRERQLLNNPDLEFLQNHANTLIHDELCYNRDELRMDHENLFSSLTTKQQSVYCKVISTVENNKGGVLFLYGYGGTEKTYIWRTLSAAIRCKGDIVLNVASSGIASLLLPGGRTAHSRFGIPINVVKTSVCSITHGLDLAALLGDGRLGGPNDGEAMIDIPEHILIKDCDDLVAPTHKVVEFINDHLLSLLPGKENVYLSSNTICESEGLNDNFNESVYSPDVLNGMKLAGLPNHRLVLKVGAPVMLLRNIDQSEGLCNGTRLRIKELEDRAIKAKILTEIKVRETVSLFRFKLTPSDKRLPLQINRRQFPISVCFAMTINKSQGQSLLKVGIYLPKPVFTHGELYVAVSRVTSQKRLKMLAYEKYGNVCTETMNVVYLEVLQKV